MYTQKVLHERCTKINVKKKKGIKTSSWKVKPNRNKRNTLNLFFLSKRRSHLPFHTGEAKQRNIVLLIINK